MKKLKKFLIPFLIVFVCVILSNVNVCAAEITEESLRGFNISNDFTFIDDDYKDSGKLSGDKWYYGKQDIWTGLYSYYNSSTNRKYYIVLASACLTSNPNSEKNGYYRFVNENMKIEVKCNSNGNVKMIKYDPESYGKTEVSDTITRTISFGIEKNGSISVDENGEIKISSEKSYNASYTISWSETIYKDNIVLNPSKLDNDNGVLYDYIFNNTTNKKINNLMPFRGSVIQRTMTIFEIKDYSQEIDDRINFEINYTARIRKMSCTVFGCSGHESMGKTLTCKYTNRGIQYID